MIATVTPNTIGSAIKNWAGKFFANSEDRQPKKPGRRTHFNGVVRPRGCSVEVTREFRANVKASRQRRQARSRQRSQLCKVQRVLHQVNRSRPAHAKLCTDRKKLRRIIRELAAGRDGDGDKLTVGELLARLEGGYRRATS